LDGNRVSEALGKEGNPAEHAPAHKHVTGVQVGLVSNGRSLLSFLEIGPTGFVGGVVASSAAVLLHTESEDLVEKGKPHGVNELDSDFGDELFRGTSLGGAISRGSSVCRISCGLRLSGNTLK